MDHNQTEASIISTSTTKSVIYCLHIPQLQNSGYLRIFRVTGANQNARKLLSTDLVNTKCIYIIMWVLCPILAKLFCKVL